MRVATTLMKHSFLRSQRIHRACHLRLQLAGLSLARPPSLPATLYARLGVGVRHAEHRPVVRLS